MSRRFTCLFALVLGACLWASAGASAELSFCPPGSGAGQCDKPQGIAVDRAAGRVYVADSGNNRIDVFSTEGEFLLAFGWGVADGTTEALQSCGPAAAPPTPICFRGIAGPGAGQFSSFLGGVAVDNDPASPAFHDVYVTSVYADTANSRVQRFNPKGGFVGKFSEGQIDNISFAAPIAVGPGGTVYLGDFDIATGKRSVKAFAPDGAKAGEAVLPSVSPSTLGIFDLAVDSSADAYILGPEGGIPKYELSEPNATLLFPGEGPTGGAGGWTAIAVGAEDHLFASRSEAGSTAISEFDSGGQLLRRFGYGEIDFSPRGLAVSAGGDVFVVGEAAGDSGDVIRLTPPPPGPLACCLQASTGNTKATLKGSVNPEGKATSYRFDYVDDDAFKAGGFSNPATKSTAETPIGSDLNLHNVEAAIGCSEPPQPSCLKPATTYHYRLVATNADGKSESEGTFTTRPPFEVGETFATDVGIDSARLNATVNPLGIPTSGYFEYVDDAAYQQSLGEGGDGFTAALQAPDVAAGKEPLDFGKGEAAKTLAVQLASLAAGTTYHYRVNVTDPFVGEAGPERTLTTFPAPTLPANPCPNGEFRSGSSALLPDCRAYEMVSPVDKNGTDIKTLVSSLNFPARFEESSADGNRFTYSSVGSFAGPQSAPWTSSYLAERIAGQGWSTQAISPAREAKSFAPYFGKFDTQYKAFSADLSTGWLTQDTDPELDPCAPSGWTNLYRHDIQTGAYEALSTAAPSNPNADPEAYAPELQGFSADGSIAVFRVNAKLTANASTAKGPAPGTTVNQLYEHIKGEGCGELRLVSVLPNGNASIKESSAGSMGGAAETRMSAVSHAVSDDGSRIFWSEAITLGGNNGAGPLYVRIDASKTIRISAETAQFWTAATDGSKAIYTSGPKLESLYEFDTAKAIAEEPASTLIASGVKGVVGASEDASRLYFVSTQSIGGEGVAGKPNLYLHDAGETKLVAELYGGDAKLPEGDLNQRFLLFPFTVARQEPIKNGVRISADGNHLAFVSAGSPTGYDNADTVDGLPNLEVYLYDAEADELRCVSCNPSGARPRGRAFFLDESFRRVSAQMAPANNQLYASRSLSADGNRLFFESFEALLPRDTNGKEDVYEWQRASGPSQCEEAGAELYVPSAGGCLSLISSGQSSQDSEFADASPDGSDAFIRTASSLVPQDPGLVDIYDARVNGGLPGPPAPVPSCEGEACQGPPSPPNDQTPASSAFEGAGNVNEAVAKKKGHAKGKAHKKRQHKKKRQRQEKQERKAGR